CARDVFGSGCDYW
nr:immunoglobulin heavy chain junction region [Macaca mulatta]